MSPQSPVYWSDQQVRQFLRSLFEEAVASVQPSLVLAGMLPEKPKGRCVVVGAGKASAAMAAALENAWPDVPLEGVVVTRDGHAVPTRHITILEASHPVPDARSESAAQAILKAVSGLGPEDMVIALISGGGSSLLVSPVQGVTLEEKQSVNKALLRSGATISEMNAVRRHLSAIKGGKLAQAAYPARVETFVMSDVPGDDPGVIASGPTIFSSATAAEALHIIERYGIELPDSARVALFKEAETEKKRTQARQVNGAVHMIATPLQALKAVAEKAEKAGVASLILGDAIEGESAAAGVVLAGVARSVRQHGLPVAGPVVLLSGGETTVTIRKGEAAGRGGRNTEFLLAAAQALAGEAGIWALAGDSDGIDGTEDAAGAIITPDTLMRGQQAGLSASDFLKGHDSYSYFSATDDLVITGPTMVNVNDIRIIFIQ
ncbi:glycerate kinase type-2 family protein [Acetobacter thailandicus]|uniref:glycerate kinase type-2 family protein n=1 Tax=Acetobacter thailandicus TaxID=1502842 RepID=UPI001BAAEC68|nr:glycerate kinase [Acetobacter thailandicus]MBS0979808.1 glycerate kinase [Acetobacter thailandicus]